MSVRGTSMMNVPTRGTSHTYYNLGYYFSSDPDNIAREASTHIQTPSGWWTFNFFPTPATLEYPTHPCPRSDSPLTWPSPSMTRRTRFTRSPSDMDAPDTDMPTPCAAPFPGWNTYATRAPPQHPPLCCQGGTAMVQRHQRRYHVNPLRRLLQHEIFPGLTYR